MQASNLVPYLKVQEQLLLIAELSGKRNRQAKQQASQLLETLGLGHRQGHYPEQLSGGERQRVAIARALINDTDVLLVDEPTASLDTARGHEVVQLIAKQVKARQKAAVMVTHDERMLSYCDRVVHITDGRLLSAAPLSV